MPVVYVLKCPKSLQVRYVGEGSQNRPHAHTALVRAGRQTANPRLTRWIANLLAEDLEPIVEVVMTSLSKQEALAIEEKMIAQYGRSHLDNGGTLLNIATRGRAYDKRGDKNPFFGKTHTVETLAKMSAAKRGKKRPDGFSETMRQIALARPPMSETTREKMRASMTGKPCSAQSKQKQSETKKLNRCRSFAGYNPDGALVIFDSVWEFAGQNGLPSNSIYKLLTTRKIGTRGLLKGWRFIEMIPNS